MLDFTVMVFRGEKESNKEIFGSDFQRFQCVVARRGIDCAAHLMANKPKRKMPVSDDFLFALHSI